MKRFVICVLILLLLVKFVPNFPAINDLINQNPTETSGLSFSSLNASEVIVRTGVPTVYGTELAAQVARYRAGLVRYPTQKLIELSKNVTSAADIKKIPGLVENEGRFNLFVTKRPKDYLKIFKGIMLGGNSMPIIAAPQVCPFIDNKDGKQITTIWDDVEIVSSWQYVDGVAQTFTPPAKLTAIIIDVHHGSCDSFVDFFTDMLPRDIAKIYGGIVVDDPKDRAPGVAMPWFRDNKGKRLDLPSIKLYYRLSQTNSKKAAANEEKGLS